MRLVIPADATPDDVAFQGKTWQQIADENGADGIQNLGDQWCVDNRVDGLGLADVWVPPPDPGPVLKTAAEIAAEHDPIETLADANAFRDALRQAGV